jgi:hypothetical protein
MKEYSMSKSTDLVAPIETDLTGFDLINTPMLNKGTAFTHEERCAFHLHGLLPPHVGTLEEQVERRLKVLRAFETDFERYAFLRELRRDTAVGLHADRWRRLPALQRNLAQAAWRLHQLSEHAPHSRDTVRLPLRSGAHHRCQRWGTNPGAR